MRRSISLALLALLWTACCPAPVTRTEYLPARPCLREPPPVAPLVVRAECEFEVCYSSAEAAKLVVYLMAVRGWMQTAWAGCAP
jgi:hypothetical protein